VDSGSNLDQTIARISAMEKSGALKIDGRAVTGREKAGIKFIYTQQKTTIGLGETCLSNEHGRCIGYSVLFSDSQHHVNCDCGHVTGSFTGEPYSAANKRVIEGNSIKQVVVVCEDMDRIKNMVRLLEPLFPGKIFFGYVDTKQHPETYSKDHQDTSYRVWTHLNPQGNVDIKVTTESNQDLRIPLQSGDKLYQQVLAEK
jgi:hypothetical protein